MNWENFLELLFCWQSTKHFIPVSDEYLASRLWSRPLCSCCRVTPKQHLPLHLFVQCSLALSGLSEKQREYPRRSLLGLHYFATLQYPVSPASIALTLQRSCTAIRLLPLVQSYGISYFPRSIAGRCSDGDTDPFGL